MTPIKELTKEIQSILGCTADGIVGRNTNRRLQEIKDKHNVNYLPSLIMERWGGAVFEGDDSKKTVEPTPLTKGGCGYPDHGIPWLIEGDKLEGTKEIPGKADNPLIIEFAHATGIDWIKTENSPWCSTSMCYVMMKAGHSFTGSAMAKSWEIYGIPCVLCVGALVVFDRSIPGKPETNWWRHVGMCRHIISSKRIKLQAGNQGNKYCTKIFGTAKITAVRCPDGWVANKDTGILVKA